MLTCKGNKQFWNVNSKHSGNTVPVNSFWSNYQNTNFSPQDINTKATAENCLWTLNLFNCGTRTKTKERIVVTGLNENAISYDKVKTISIRKFKGEWEKVGYWVLYLFFLWLGDQNIS